MQSILFLTSAGMLLISAFIVFRRIVSKDYLEKGHLTRFSSFLELLIFALYMSFPYLFLPPQWPWFWEFHGTSSYYLQILGFVLVLLGLLLAFGTMFWFGIRRAFGVEVDGLITHGPYRFSRNPQMLGAYLMVIGIAVQWLSWYAFGWVLIFAVIGHMMILTEEQHLRASFIELYERYCEQVPRYLGLFS